MKREFRRHSSVRNRLRTEDDITTWLTSNQQPGYVPATNQAPKVRFVQPDPIPEEGSDISDDSDSTLTEEPRYLNGGYGWIVVAFSFLLHFIADGLSFSFGVLFPKIQERFGARRFGASSVASLFLSMPLILGPIAGFVTDVCDCKKTILIGGIICTIGALTSYFCMSIATFTLCFGGIIGVGLSLVYNAAIVMVTYNFELRRGLATALAVSGTGVGTIIFPFFMNYFLPDEGTDIGRPIIAITFVFASVIVIGLCLKDVEWDSDTPEYKMKVFHRRLKKLQKMEQDQESMKNGDCGKLYQEIQPRRACSLPSIPSYFQPFIRKMDTSASVQSIKDAVSGLHEQPARSRSVGTFMNRPARSDLPIVPEYSMLAGQGLETLEHLDLQLSNSPSTTIYSRGRHRMLSKTSMSMDAINAIDEDGDVPVKITIGNGSTADQTLESETDSESGTESDSERSNDGDSSSSELSDRCLNKDKTKANTFANGMIKVELGRAESACLPMSARLRYSLAPGMSGMTGSRVPASNAVTRYRIPSNLIAYQGKMPSAPTLAVRKKRKDLMSKLHLKALWKGVTDEIALYKFLLRKPSYVLILISVTSLYFVLDVPYVFFYDYAVENLGAVESSAAHLTSIIGVTNLMSTWICGFVSDIECVKKRLFNFYGIAMFGLTMSYWMVPLVNSVFGMAVICAIFGFCISSNYVLQSLLLTIIWEDIRNFQSSYAFASFCEGLATLVGPPIIGFIRDHSGTYTSIYIVSGFLCLFSAILAGFVQHLIDKERTNSKITSNHMRLKDDIVVPLNGPNI